MLGLFRRDAREWAATSDSTTHTELRMQQVLNKQQVEAADRQVGVAVGAIGTFVVIFMIAVVSGLSMYYQSFYTWLH